MRRWQLQEAKARLSEVVRAAAKEPQQITVHGEPAAVVVSEDRYRALMRKKPSFVAFLRRSPLVGVRLALRRDTSPARALRL